MNLEIITPEKLVYEGEINLIQLPGSTGSFELLANHAPIIATLKAGKIKIEEKATRKTMNFNVNGGVVEMLNNKVIVLAE